MQTLVLNYKTEFTFISLFSSAENNTSPSTTQSHFDVYEMCSDLGKGQVHSGTIEKGKGLEPYSRVVRALHIYEGVTGYTKRDC